jgi:PD-(D/E)XK endonuclease
LERLWPYIVAADLIGLGYYVFTELGDICKSDLIVMDNNYVPIKVQVKARTLKDGAIIIKSSKDGPNYRFEYEDKHADIYAIYIVKRDLILYISNQELLKHRSLTIRTDATKNNQSQDINWASTYADFKKALRDSTYSI